MHKSGYVRTQCGDLVDVPPRSRLIVCRRILPDPHISVWNPISSLTDQTPLPPATPSLRPIHLFQLSPSLPPHARCHRHQSPRAFVGSRVASSAPPSPLTITCCHRSPDRGPPSRAVIGFGDCRSPPRAIVSAVHYCVTSSALLTAAHKRVPSSVLLTAAHHCMPSSASDRRTPSRTVVSFGDRRSSDVFCTPLPAFIGFCRAKPSIVSYSWAYPGGPPPLAFVGFDDRRPTSWLP